MKRVLSVSLILLIVSSAVSARYYVSNELGQKKGDAASYDYSEWVLDERGKEEILYHNGAEYSRKLTTESGWTKTKDGVEETVYLNSDGNIERKVIRSASSTQEYNYFYKGTLLSSYNYSVDGVLQYKIEYLTTSDGSLLYYREKDEGIYVTDEWFVFENGERMEVGSYEGENIVSTLTEDGGYEEVSEEGMRRYDSSGRLVYEKSETSAIEYTYSEDGVLLEKKESGDDGFYITSYTDEGEVLSRYSSDGVKITERRLLPDSYIEERRFVDGEAKYVYIYDSDGRRIREAYAL